MGNWWKISRLEMYLGLKDREALVWSLIAPLLFTAFIGYAFNSDSDPSPIKVAYKNGSNPEYVEKIFRSFLEKENFVIASGKKLPVIAPPDSLIEKILAGKGAKIVIEVEEESRSARAIAAKTRKILYTLMFSARKEWLEHPPGESELQALLEESGPLKLNTATLGKAPRKLSGVERTLPSVVVMFLLFSLFTFYASLWVEDTKTGKIRRIILSPTSMKDLFFAQISSRLLWGIMQVVVVGIAGTLIFRIRWELPFFSASILILAYMFAITAMGMLFGSLFDNPDKANVVGVILSLVLSAVGGCWWPLEIVPGPMKIAALFTPTGLAMDAFGSFLANGKLAPFPVFNVFCLIAMSIIIMPLAIHRMKKQIIR